jgi:hypothetical protein
LAALDLGAGFLAAGFLGLAGALGGFAAAGLGAGLGAAAAGAVAAATVAWRTEIEGLVRAEQRLGMGGIESAGRWGRLERDVKKWGACQGRRSAVRRQADMHRNRIRVVVLLLTAGGAGTTFLAAALATFLAIFLELVTFFLGEALGGRPRGFLSPLGITFFLGAIFSISVCRSFQDRQRLVMEAPN